MSAAAIQLLHFNDVYEIEAREQEPRGGAARFVSLVRRLEAASAQSPPLVLFSGDVFAPSMLSTVTRGKHMVPILNLLNIAAAVYGNHDFDHGVHRLAELASKCAFPWLMSNVWDRDTGGTLGNGHEWLVLEWQGRRVGLIGLIEREWLETLATLAIDHVRYESFVDVGRRLARMLRAEHHVDLVVALTHMRQPNDELLAREVQEIDLVLGGHDHDYFHTQIGRVHVVKSGCDFRDASRIEIAFAQTDQDQADALPVLSVTVERLATTSDIPEDPETAAIVASFAEVLAKQGERVLCKLDTAMDARFEAIRTQETNAANWIADIMTESLNADVALLNSGSLRADQVIPAGVFRVRDLIKLLPMHDELVIVKVTGKQLLAALENGVSKYPKKEGRFPCVSGVRFAFDPDKPENERVVVSSVTVRGKPLDLAADYRLVTKSYLQGGRDGYTSLVDAEVVTSPEDLPVLPVLVRNHLTMMNVAKRFVTNDMLVRHAASRFLAKRRRVDASSLTEIPETTPSSALPASETCSLTSPPLAATGAAERSHSADSAVGVPHDHSDDEDEELPLAESSSDSLRTPLRRSLSSAAAEPGSASARRRPTIVVSSPIMSTPKRARPLREEPLQDLLLFRAFVDGRTTNVKQAS